jgi:hypothetical protein
MWDAFWQITSLLSGISSADRRMASGPPQPAEAVHVQEQPQWFKLDATRAPTLSGAGEQLVALPRADLRQVEAELPDTRVRPDGLQGVAGAGFDGQPGARWCPRSPHIDRTPRSRAGAEPCRSLPCRAVGLGRHRRARSGSLLSFLSCRGLLSDRFGATLKRSRRPSAGGELNWRVAVCCCAVVAPRLACSGGALAPVCGWRIQPPMPGRSGPRCPRAAPAAAGSGAAVRVQSPLFRSFRGAALAP